MSDNPYTTPETNDSPNLTQSSTASKYATYSDVPVYRRQWFFWLFWLIFAPIALGILLSGNVYYVKKGVVVPFGIANKILGVLISLVWIAQFIKAFTG